MTQKAWMNAYTKGSKEMQARLARVHAKNPEFQEFIKNHGFGGTLSVKQSGKQQKTAAQATVAAKPVGSEDRLELIKKAALKLRDRHLAASNRAHFGGELGGDFSIGRSGFRRYSESLDETVAANFRKIVPGLGKAQAFNRAKDPDNELDSGIASKSLTRKQRMQKAKHIERFARIAGGGSAFRKEDWTKTSTELGIKPGERDTETFERDQKILARRKPNPYLNRPSFASGLKKRANIAYLAGKKVNEEIPYHGATLTMKRGGWVAIRDGKQIGVVHPTKELAMKLVDNTHKSFMHNIGRAIRKKAKDVARSMDLKRSQLATESAKNRRRIRSWDSAVLKDRSNDPPFTPDKPKANLGVVVGKNDPGYSKARHLARLGLKQQMKRDRINATVDYVSNPKYSVLNKNTINSLLKGK